MSSSHIPWDEIDEELLSRYSAPAPRYTSYPTAPEWTDTFGREDYRTVLARADNAIEQSLSIYVHVPYCRERCLYCGCASWLVRSNEDYDIYLEALAREVSAVSTSLNRRRKVSQLHWGGGTPTTLNPARLERLFEIITRGFELNNDAEVAIEVNPAVTSIEQIDTLAKLGFNRVSMGVQDFTPEVQEAVGRPQGVKLTQTLIDRAREKGFGGVNIDLMYGLPRQTMDSWRVNLERVIGILPDRLAVFGYAHVPWMRPHQKMLNENELPDTSARFELFRLAHDMLIDAGYIYIGMDHFARPEDELAQALKQRRLWRNFQGYTVHQAADLVGFGVTGISDVAGAFAQNSPVLDHYLAETKTNGIATYRGMETSPEDRLRRHVITGLMCNLHLDIRAVEERFDINYESTFSAEQAPLEELVRDGIIEMDKQTIRVTPKGRIFVRHVGLVFDTYTRDRAEGGPRFSKTV